MASGTGAAMLILGGLLVGTATGWLLASTGAPERVEELETALARETEKADRVRQRIAVLEARLKGNRKGGRGSGEARSAPGAEVELDPGGVPDADAVAAMAAEEDADVAAARRAGRVAEAAGRIDGVFERGDGKQALALLKELAALVPEGREAAMDLAVRMNEDVNGPGALKLSQMVFYGQLGDPAVRGLMQWSLENPSEADFRILSAWSLPWTQQPDETTRRFVKALRTAGEYGVQEALIVNLSRLRQPDAEKALAELLADADRSSFLRARVATELASSDDPAIAAALEQVAYGDPDPDVQAAAAAALVIKDPPATGFLVTGTTPDSQGASAGFRAGDILLRYGEAAVTTDWGLYQATRQAKGDQPIKVVVLRGGGEVELLVQPGNLGVYGRAVKSERAE